MKLSVPWKRPPKAAAPIALYPLCISSSGAQVYRVPSETDPSVWYLVNLDRQTCSCGAFTYRQRCKHLRRFSDSQQAYRRGVLR